MSEATNLKPSVLVTESLKSYLKDSIQYLDFDLSNQVENYLSSYKPNDQNFIPINFLKKVHKIYNFARSGLYLNDLLYGSYMKLPHKILPPRNPQLEERIKKLKNRFEEEEYKKMVKNVTQNFNNGKESLGGEYKELNKHLITIFNFLLTVVCMFVFAYKATEYAIGKSNVALQLMAGLVAATVVFIADIYFIIQTDL